MINNKYMIEICGGVCPLLQCRDFKSYHCGHNDAMNLINFKDDCKGNLDEKPSWCPLKEIKEANRFDVDNKQCFVIK